MANKQMKNFTMDGVTYDIPQGGGGDVSGVKGQQESSYRTGNVNLTPDNILFLGTNPITSISDDTQAFWKNKGSGYCYINTAGVTNEQPSQYGVITSYVIGNTIAQNWYSIRSGKMYYRGANSNDTTMPAWIPVDSPRFINAYDIANFSCPNNAYTFSADFYTAPRAGKAIVTGNVSFATNSTGYRSLAVYRNRAEAGIGALVIGASPSGATQLSIAGVVLLAEGDTLQLRVRQNSGSALAMSDCRAKVLFIADY